MCIVHQYQVIFRAIISGENTTSMQIYCSSIVESTPYYKRENNKP